MADADDGQQTVGRSASGPPPTQRPHWVKVTLIVVAPLVVLLVVAKVTGLGGEHGPGRHGGGGDVPSSVVGHDDGHRPPVDHGP